MSHVNSHPCKFPWHSLGVSAHKEVQLQGYWVHGGQRSKETYFTPYNRARLCLHHHWCVALGLVGHLQHVNKSCWNPAWLARKRRFRHNNGCLALMNIRKNRYMCFPLTQVHVFVLLGITWFSIDTSAVYTVTCAAVSRPENKVKLHQLAYMCSRCWWSSYVW